MPSPAPQTGDQAPDVSLLWHGLCSCAMTTQLLTFLEEDLNFLSLSAEFPREVNVSAVSVL